jgi:hypothetical protein
LSKKIENIITKSKRGKLIFISDFLQYGSYEAIRKSLQRFVNRKILIRISKGIYLYPKVDKTFGILYPTAEEVGKAVAKRDKARIIPTGVYAQHLLGLSTQIPMNVVYLTDGSARKLKIGNQTIVFKKTSPKNLCFDSQLSSLIIQSLKSLKENNTDHSVKQQLVDVVKQSGEAEKIRKDIENAPVWIQKIVQDILSNITNELA